MSNKFNKIEFLRDFLSVNLIYQVSLYDFNTDFVAVHEVQFSFLHTFSL